MWISRKKFSKLEKKVADLEGEVQGQHKVSPLETIQRALHDATTLSVDQGLLMHQR